MPLKKYLIVMALSNAVLWVAWGLVLVSLDPSATGFVGHLLFYASLGLAVAGTVSLIDFFLRSLFFRSTPHFRHLGVSHRHGFLLAILLIASLVLQSQRLFTWWSGLIVVLVVVGIEYLFLLRQQPA